MNIIPPIIAHAQASELVQQSQRLLHNVTTCAESTSIFCIAPSNGCGNATLAKRIAMRIAVVPAITHDLFRFAQRPAGLAADRRDCIDERKQLGNIMAIGCGENQCQRYAFGVDDDMVFRARLRPVYGVGARFFPPCTARTDAESTMTREKSIASAPRSLSSSRW